MADPDTTIEEILCREFVELVTDYLEGALPEPSASSSSRSTW